MDSVVGNEYLQLISGDGDIIVGPVDVTEFLPGLDISSLTDELIQLTPETPPRVYRWVRDATLKQIFCDPDKQYFTSTQIVAFVRYNRKWLNKSGDTFFLLKHNNDLFIVIMNFISIDDSDLRTYVYPFKGNDIWPTNPQPYVVFP
jgi:hypothetical protein